MPKINVCWALQRALAKYNNCNLKTIWSFLEKYLNCLPASPRAFRNIYHQRTNWPPNRRPLVNSKRFKIKRNGTKTEILFKTMETKVKVELIPIGSWNLRVGRVTGSRMVTWNPQMDFKCRFSYKTLVLPNEWESDVVECCADCFVLR